MAKKLKRSKWKRFVKYCADRSCKKISGRQILAMLFWTRFATFVYIFLTQIILFRILIVKKALEVVEQHNLAHTPFWFLCGVWQGIHLAVTSVYLCVFWVGIKKESRFFLLVSAVFAILNLLNLHGFGMYLLYFWYSADNVTIMEYIQPAIWFTFMFFLSLAEVHFCIKYGRQLNSQIVDKILEEYHTFDNDCVALLKKDKDVNVYINEETPNKCPNSGFETVPGVHLDVFKKFMISPWKVKDVKVVLGEGHFGVVTKGYLKREGSIIPVALKTPLSAVKDLSLFVKEIKVMIFVGNHDNIVRFFGVMSDASIEGHLSIIMEYCLSTLQKYLMDNRSLFSSTDYSNLFTSGVKTSSVFVRVEQPFTKEYGILDLLQFAQQIASGMKFLASKNVIHGDLALRNVLITKENCVKITDFGISQKLYDKLYHRSLKGDGPALFPWRWSSIEVMSDLMFSQKSDVWAFGVTLWEIFSLGKKPYADISWSPDVLTRIQNGHRLGRPEFAIDEIYNLMLCCWEPEAEQRPSFKDIYTMITSTIKQFKAIKFHK